MDDRKVAVLGIVGLLTAYMSIGASIILSPWFCWCENALSDLGHVVRSNVAPLFNFGLLLSGFFIAIYALVLRKHAKYTGYALLTSSFLLQLVATVNETYGSLHTLVSILFFTSLGFTSIVYCMEKRSQITLVLVIIGLLTWLLYFTGTYRSGIAVPEMISVGTVSTWVMLSAIKLFLGGYFEI